MIFLAAIITNNILLSDFLGLCAFVAISRMVRTSLGMGAAVTFVMSVTTPLNYLVYHYVLVPEKINGEVVNPHVLVPQDLRYLKLIIFIVIIAAFVQLVEMVIERFTPVLYYNLGIFLPLITVNCAILGASLFMVIRNYSFAQTVCYGVGSGLGWALVITLMAGVRQRLRFSNIPDKLQGLGVTMILTALMAMAFMGFTGMVTIQ